jgi:hypothetical protein
VHLCRTEFLKKYLILAFGGLLGDCWGKILILMAF